MDRLEVLRAGRQAGGCDQLPGAFALMTGRNCADGVNSASAVLDYLDGIEVCAASACADPGDAFVLTGSPSPASPRMSHEVPEQIMKDGGACRVRLWR